MFYSEEENNWICPSDRKLILRAKLHLGWSIHSHDGFRRHEPVPESDMMVILHVLARACQVEEMEHKRVGSLVQRLENMKRNAWGNGLDSCAMCAQSLGWFKNASFPCMDCKKFVCDKCCVDTWSVMHEPLMLCKICAENRELWKKSGGWFYGYLPVQKENMNQLSNHVNSSQATWSHRIPDIVCFESFEPPQITQSNEERFIGRTWASNSSISGDDTKERDFASSAETIDSSDNTNRFLTTSNIDIADKGGSMNHLSALDKSNNLELSVFLSNSCPSLVSHHKTKQTVHDQSNGILEFSLMYNSRSKVLQCTVYCVKDLIIYNLREAKYYLKLVLNQIKGKEIYSRTKSITGGAKIDFNEILVLSKIPRNIRKDTSLTLLLMMEDHFNDIVEGQVSVDMMILKPNESKFFVLPIIKKTNLLDFKD